MIGFPELPQRYSVIFCDLWGCVHDGYRVFPGVVQRLLRWKAEGRKVVFLTNAPRSSEIIASGLLDLSIPREAFDAVVSAGDAGIAELKGREVGFVGTAADRADLSARGLTLVKEGFNEIACAGLTAEKPQVEDFADSLREWRDRDIVLHCLNPDRVVIHGDERMVCAGSLADAYEALGGTVHWYGKPYPEIYREAFRVAGEPERRAVLAIGDGLATDMLGAARQGLDAIYVASGIHAGEPFPADFAAANCLGDWAPIATVAAIGA